MSASCSRCGHLSLSHGSMGCTAMVARHTRCECAGFVVKRP